MREKSGSAITCALRKQNPSREIQRRSRLPARPRRTGRRPRTPPVPASLRHCRRGIRAIFPAYTRRIYVLTFRMVSGFESCGPLAQVSPPLFASCTSGRRFAYSFLQIPPRDGHPCCSASSSHHQGLQRTCTAKSTKWPPQPIRSRLRATRHAWRTTKWRSAAEADPRIDSCFKPLSWPLAVGFLLASVPAWLSPLRRTPA